MPRVYLIEDDGLLRQEILHLLELNGYDALAFGQDEAPDKLDFSLAALQALEAQADLIIVDLKLPDYDGLSVVRDARRQSSVPILILTSSDQEFDEIMALNLGADGYLTKPFRPQVFLAHLAAALRRGTGSQSEAHDDGSPSRLVSVAGVCLDLDRGKVAHDGTEVELTRNELRILRLLMQHAGAIVSRPALMNELWNSDEFIDDNTLTVNVNRLRTKLTQIGIAEDFIQTRRGQGYQLIELPKSQ